MHFINPNRLALVASLALCLLLLSACGSAPTQDQGNGRINPKARMVDVPAAAQSEYQAVVLKAISNKNWSRAEASLERMQAAYPSIKSIQVMLGWVYWQQGKIKQAETELLDATKSRGLYKADAFNYLAILYREQGDFTKAETSYQRALKIWPGDPILHKNLGILYELYLGRLNDALLAYKKAQALSNNDKQLKGWIKDLERRVKSA